MAYCRRLTAADMRTVIRIAKQFHAESPVHGVHPFDEEQLHALVMEAIGAPNYLPACVMDDGEMVGVMLLFHMPMFFGPATEVGDLAFYVVPDRRGTRAAQLMLEYGERWCLARGATVLRLGITTGIRNEAVQRFFEKNGHRQIGVLMEKTL